VGIIAFLFSLIIIGLGIQFGVSSMDIGDTLMGCPARALTPKPSKLRIITATDISLEDLKA
jgi:hypothetical protein